MVAAEDVAVEAAPVAPEATGERNGKETVAQVAVPRKRALPAQDRHAKSARSASAPAHRHHVIPKVMRQGYVWGGAVREKFLGGALPRTKHPRAAVYAVYS